MTSWNFEQLPRESAADDSTVNLRAYLDRMPDEKMRQYQPEWTGAQLAEWCGDFREDGVLFLVCSERDIGVDEFRSELEACIEYRRSHATALETPSHPSTDAGD